MLILIRISGEISTKARRTRSRFLKRLAANIEDALRSEGISFELRRGWSRLFVEAESPQALEVISRVFGVQSLSVVERRPGSSLEEIVQAGEELFRERVRGKRFAVRARRTGSKDKIPFGSRDIERALGAALLPYALKVDLESPEVTAYVEVREGQAYFFTEQIPGPGGLPIGVEGRAVALISGGFDSVVAAWLMLKRGVALDYLSCNLAGEAHRQGVLRVLRLLVGRWGYGDRPKLHLIDFEPLVRELQSKVEPRYWQVVLKRLMIRAAENVAQEIRSPALITGEAVGQVSSQTLQNLAVISQTAKLPILRPLAGSNKEEIIEQARRIGTYELSASVAEYCALVPRQPATRASLKAVLAQEERLDLTLLERAVAERSIYDIRSIDPEELAPAELEIAEIPEGATVIDLRPAAAYRTWHYPGAIHMDLFEALENINSLERDKTYVLYCELGLKSAYLAERMRKEGYRAFNFKGGLKGLMRYALEHDLLPAELVPPSLLL